MTNVFSIAASGQTAFAALSTGLLRSRDGGMSWQPCLSPQQFPPDLPITAVALSPRFTGDGTLFAATQGALIKSTDAGDTWKTATLPTPAPFITSLALSPAFELDHTIFAASFEDGVFRSTDGGATWNAWNFGLLDAQVLALAIAPDFANSKTVFAGTGTGLFVSHNAGRAWSEIALPCGNVPVLSVTAEPGLLLSGTEGSGLYASRDSGIHWERWGDKDLETVNGVFVTDETILALTNDGLYSSNDLGENWKALPLKEDSIPVAASLIYDGTAGKQLIVGYENGRIREG